MDAGLRTTPKSSPFLDQSCRHAKFQHRPRWRIDPACTTDPSLQLLQGKTVKITGTIKLYHGKPVVCSIHTSLREAQRSTLNTTAALAFDQAAAYVAPPQGEA